LTKRKQSIGQSIDVDLEKGLPDPYERLSIVRRKFGQSNLADFYSDGDSRHMQRFLSEMLHGKLLQKLSLIVNAKTLSEIGQNKGNDLKRMKGKYDGVFSVKLNLNYRILFRWHKTDGANEIRLIARKKI